jgi:hypothetical protein
MAQFRIFLMLALVSSCGAAAQAKGMLVYGTLYRMQAGFLELKTGEKQFAVMKVDAATIYWDGKTDKAAAKKDLSLGGEIIAEMTEKDGAIVTKKVRFLHRGF